MPRGTGSVKELKHFPLDDAKCTRRARKDLEMELIRSPRATLQEAHDPVPKNVSSAADLDIGPTNVQIEFSVRCVVDAGTRKGIAPSSASSAQKFIHEASVSWSRRGKISGSGIQDAMRKLVLSKDCQLASCTS
jgi:hypothetical protein